MNYSSVPIFISWKVKKHIITIFCLFVLGTSLQSCHKKEPCLTDGVPSVMNIMDELKAKVPYKDFAELTFVDSISGDTHVFKGQGWESSYWWYRNWEITCDDGTNCQRIVQKFGSTTYPLSIQFGMVTTLPSNTAQYVNVNLTKYEYYLWYGYMKDGNAQKVDSLWIQNKWYYNVNYFKNNYNSQWETPYGCYYNSTFGLLKIQTEEGTLELLKMKN